MSFAKTYVMKNDTLLRGIYRVAQKERKFLKWVVVGRVKVFLSLGLPQIKSLRSKTSESRRSESFHSRRNCNCATRNVSKCDAEL